MSKKMDLRCLRCSYEFSAQFGNIKSNGAGCPSCAGRLPYAESELLDTVKKSGGQIVGKLPGRLHSKIKIKIRCKNNHTFKMSLGRLRSGRWCQACRTIARTYTDKEIISFIQRLNAQLGRPPRFKDFSILAGPSYDTAVLRFGSLENALKAAGYETIKYTKSDAIKSLNGAYDRIGAVPSRQMYIELGLEPSAAIVVRFFGSWSKAVKAAGFKPRAGMGGRRWKLWERYCEEAAMLIWGRRNIQPQLRYSTEHSRSIDIYVPALRLGVDAKLSAYHHEGTTHSQISEFYKTDMFDQIEFWCLDPGILKDKRVVVIPVDQIIQRLQRVRKKREAKDLIRKISMLKKGGDSARKAAGLPTKSELLQEMREFITSHGRLPGQREFRTRNGLRSAGTYESVFGSLSAALQAVGGNMMRYIWRKKTDAELIKVFKRFMKDCCGGRVPTVDEVRTAPAQYPKLGVYTKRAGTYTKWLKLCGLASQRVSQNRRIASLDDREALAILKRAYRKSGKPLVGKDNDFHKYVDWAPSKEWYSKRFGSWRSALLKAGLPASRTQTVNYSKAKALALLRKALRASGGKLVGKGSDYRKYIPEAPTVDWYRREFGSWSNAVKMAEVY